MPKHNQAPFLIDNHYETIYWPVRSECFSCMLQSIPGEEKRWEKILLAGGTSKMFQIHENSCVIFRDFNLLL